MSKKRNYLDLMLTDIQFLSKGKGLKANVYRATYNSRLVVVKDYSEVAFYFKPIAKRLAEREILTLNYLQDSPHIAQLVRILDPYRFITEFVEGTHPCKELCFQNETAYYEAKQFLSSRIN